MPATPARQPYTGRFATTREVETFHALEDALDAAQRTRVTVNDVQASSAPGRSLRSLVRDLVGLRDLGMVEGSTLDGWGVEIETPEAHAARLERAFGPEV